MFYCARAFNGDLSKCNVEKVTDMIDMYEPFTACPTKRQLSNGLVNPMMAPPTPDQYCIGIDAPQRVGSGDHQVQKIEDL